MKKTYFILVILIIATIGMTFLYFSTLNTKSTENDSAISVASKNAALVFCYDNDKSFYEILSGENLLDQVLGEQKSKLFHQLKQNLAQQVKISEFIEGQKIYISILPDENKGTDFLISAALKKEIDIQKIVGQIPNLIHQKTLNGVLTLTFTDSSRCYMAIDKQLVFISNVKKSINNALNASTTQQDNFANYIKTNSLNNKNTLAKVFINFNQAPEFLKNIVHGNLSSEFAFFNKLDAFATLNYNFSNKKLLFNGTSQINQNHYFNLFTNSAEQKISINGILPEQTANYTIFTTNNYAEWQKELYHLMPDSKDIQLNLKLINKKYGLNLSQIVEKYYQHQFVTFQLKNGEKFGAIALNNGEKFNQLLLDLSTEPSPAIRVFNEDFIPYAFFGEPFKKFVKPFYTVIDNYLILSNTASNISQFLNDYQNNKLLINNKNYINLNNQLSPSASIFFYVNLKNSARIFENNLSKPYLNHYVSPLGLKTFDSFCYQLSGDNHQFITTLILQKQSEEEAKTTP